MNITISPMICNISQSFYMRHQSQSFDLQAHNHLSESHLVSQSLLDREENTERPANVFEELFWDRMAERYKMQQETCDLQQLMETTYFRNMVATLQEEVALKDFMIQGQAKIIQHLKAALTEMYECNHHLKREKYQVLDSEADICSDSEPEVSDPEPEVPDPEVDISDPEPEVPDTEVVVSDPEPEVPDPEPEVPNHEVVVSDPEPEVPIPEPEVPDPEVDISDPEPEITDPEPEVPDPEVDVSDPEPKVSFKDLPQKMDMVAFGSSSMELLESQAPEEPQRDWEREGTRPKRRIVTEDKPKPKRSRVRETGETHGAALHRTDMAIILTHSLSAITHTVVTVVVYLSWQRNLSQLFRW